MTYTVKTEVLSVEADTARELIVLLELLGQPVIADPPKLERIVRFSMDRLST